MKYFILGLTLCLVGCLPPTPEREKLFNYKCSASQLDALNKQYKICNNSGYISSYCYLHATASACDYVGPK